MQKQTSSRRSFIKTTITEQCHSKCQ